MLRSRPGDRDWLDFCQWIREFLVVDVATGYIVYRPRDESHFRWTSDPAAAARRWNVASAGRPVRVYRRRRQWAYCKVDGLVAAWSSVRAALGILDRRYDLNSALPDPKDLSDAELVQLWGIDYAIMRAAMLHENQIRKAEVFEAAVAAVERRIGRMLTADERARARKNSRIDKAE